MSRRDLVVFRAKVGAMLGLSSALIPQLVRALQQTQRPSVIWPQLQECTGCVESTIRTQDPTIGGRTAGDILLEGADGAAAVLAVGA